MEIFSSYHYDKIQALLTQGSFLKFLHLEQTDASWKSFLYSLPKGVMSFVIRFFFDCLPSLATLKRMNERTTTRYIHCNNHEILRPILNCWCFYLNQGRYTQKKNSVLLHLVVAVGSVSSSVTLLLKSTLTYWDTFLLTQLFPPISYQQTIGLILSYFFQTKKFRHSRTVYHFRI